MADNRALAVAMVKSTEVKIAGAVVTHALTTSMAPQTSVDITVTLPQLPTSGTLMPMASKRTQGYPHLIVAGMYYVGSLQWKVELFNASTNKVIPAMQLELRCEVIYLE